MQADIGLFLLRIVAGVVFLVHGWPKIKNWNGTYKWLVTERFPVPQISVFALSLGETFGGLFLILGLFVVPTSIVLALLMAGAVVYHFSRGDSWEEAEKAILLLAISVALALGGGGAWILL